MTKRLIFIDFIRGMMIFYMVVLHAFLYRVVHQYKPLFYNIMTTSPLIVRIIGAPFIFFSLWGSFFCMLGGIVFIYRVRTDYESIENFRAGSYFLKRGFSGVLLIIIQYIWLTFLSPESTEHPGPSTYSLLTGTIEQLHFSSFNIMHYSTTGMIESLGWIIVALSSLGYFVYRKKGDQKKKFYAFFCAAIIISITISVFLEILIDNPTDFFDELYNNGQILLVIFLLKLTSNRFSFFPLIVFGLIGALIGFLIYNKREKQLTIVMLSTGLICIVGYIVAIVMGFNMMSGYTSDYVPLPLNLLNLGSQLLFIAAFHLLFRKYQHRERERDVGIVRFFQMYSSTSLTVYFLEPLTSILLFQIVQNLYFQPISDEFYVWMGFLVLNALLWYGILSLWRKRKYKFSIEWILTQLKKKIR